MNNDFIRDYQHHIESVLDSLLPSQQTKPHNLHEAIRYVCLDNRSKRVRPILVYLIGEMLGAKKEALDFAAVSVELIHTYSLVHDDLPAMDDDDLRRGKPTCHKKYTDAMAILVGDALQAMAYEMLANDSTSSLSDKIKLKRIQVLASACNSKGMVGGQVLDIASKTDTTSIDELETIHEKKTQALLVAAVQLGALSANCQDEAVLSKLTVFAKNIGLAFQIQDDILDVESTTEVLGKPQNSDSQKDKATYVSLTDIKSAKATLHKLHIRATNIIKELTSTPLPLITYCRYLLSRQF